MQGFKKWGGALVALLVVSVMSMLMATGCSGDQRARRLESARHNLTQLAQVKVVQTSCASQSQATIQCQAAADGIAAAIAHNCTVLTMEKEPKLPPVCTAPPTPPQQE